MKIILLEDFGIVKQDKVINLPKLFAMALIKRGVAKEDKGQYLVGELCCRDLCVINDWEDTQYVQDTLEDGTSFYFQPKKIGIYVYRKPRSVDMMSDCYDKYMHIASGTTVKVEAPIKMDKYDMIINHSAMYSLVDNFAQDLQERGWDENTMLTSSQVRNFEHELNNKYKYFVFGLDKVEGYTI